MKTKLFSFVLLFIVGSFGFGQSIQFVSERTGAPLPNVTVFTAAGALLTTSDVDGKIQKSALTPVQELYVLVYESYPIGNLNQQDLNRETIKLNDRISEIQPVIISSTKAKYMNVRGHFNVYLTVNREFNVYADGIATYVYDNERKKLKNVVVEQYRTFLKNDDGADRKKVASLVYDGFLKVPDLDDIGRMKEHKANSKNKYKEVKAAGGTRMQIHRAALQDKAFSIFGYSFYDLEYLNTVRFAQESVALRDFTEFNEQLSFKIKHKSEPNFHQMIKYANFIPVEVTFSDSPGSSKAKLIAQKSSYTYDYWKAKGFPNMQPIFGTFFKDNLKEGPNGAKP